MQPYSAIQPVVLKISCRQCSSQWGELAALSRWSIWVAAQYDLGDPRGLSSLPHFCPLAALKSHASLSPDGPWSSVLGGAMREAISTQVPAEIRLQKEGGGHEGRSLRASEQGPLLKKGDLASPCSQAGARGCRGL